MSQNQNIIVDPSENGLSHISFQQKSTGLSLVITGGATLYFIARAWPMRSTAVAGDAIPAGYGGLVITTVILIIVAQIPHSAGEKWAKKE